MPAQHQPSQLSVYQLKVTLKGSKPPIWRRIQVMSDARLDQLHRILQVVMGWEDYHLHQFIAQGIYYGIPDTDSGLGDVKNEKNVILSQILPDIKSKLTYEYDFGDGWEHEILLEKIVPAKEGADYPLCLTGKRACPPEDCGGIWGYYDFLQAIQDADHPEHDDMLEWVGGHFDPEAFNLDEINQGLKGIQSPRPRFGYLPPRYAFVLNPYQDARFTKCPQCEQRTRLRKFALLIHIDQFGLLTQGKTCRFCPECELLIVHQDELEAQLVESLSHVAPEAIGNDYLVFGTVDRKTWRKGMRENLSLDDLRQHAADFEEVLQVGYEPGGWYPADEE